MLYESEILTIYKAENGFVVKCKQPPEAETKKSDIAKDYKDEMNVYQTIAQVIKKVKEELAPGDMEEDKKEKDAGETFKSAFKEAAKRK